MQRGSEGEGEGRLAEVSRECRVQRCANGGFWGTEVSRGGCSAEVSRRVPG